MKNHRLVILVFAFLPWLVFFGCDAGTKSVDACGDSFVDPGEECDTDVGEHSCASLGHYDALGELKCTDGCKFDRADCGGRCGDNLVDVGDAEQCDGENLNGKSCQSLGYGGGELACSPICQFVLTGCTNACGNGYVEGAEACDDGNNREGDGCSTACAVEEGWACEAGNPSACAPVCLDGQVVGDEDCDLENLEGETCVGLGYYGGELACDFSCAFDESGCEAMGRCGDGAIQGDFSEVCDGAELGGQSCQGLGYYGGALACQANCRGFDVTGCTASGRCGDNTIQEEHGEVCDGISLGGRNCQDEGYFTGTLACDADCAGYDVSGCVVISTCGDGEVQTVNGESCDGLNLNGQSCITRGYYAGDLACRDHCMGFDESLCEGRCGDGALQAHVGEVCDGAELVGQTCADQGFYAGTLACSANCTSFNVVGCTGYCGDSTVQSGYGEVCDGLNLSGQSCTTQGYYGGTLTCNSNCQTFGLADCAAVGRCGDSLIQGGFGEVCDGNNLSGQTCTSRGYYGGTLACASTCNGFNENACAVVGKCGDGVIQAAYGEVCDGGNLSGQTCEARGFYGGILACSADCRAFVETNCAAVGRCGDGAIQSGYGEVCDGANLNGQSCEARGFYGGILACSADCRTLVETNCVAVGRCGDGTIQSTYEQCDGLNLGGADCVTRGFYTGTLACDLATCQYDTGGCQYFCGDGAIQSAYGEQCDGANLGGATCMDAGLFFGTVACTTSCAFGGTCNDTKLWGSSQSDYGFAISIDTTGNVFIAGTTTGNIDGQVGFGSNDGFITKFGPNGTKEWTRIMGTSSTDGASGVAVNSAGHVFVTGATYGNLDGYINSGDADIFLTQFDPSGAKVATLVWGTSVPDTAEAVAIDSSDSIYITGEAGHWLNGQPGTGGGYTFAIKLDLNRNLIWTRTWGATSGTQIGNSIAVDEFGNIYVAGVTNVAMDGQTHYGGKDYFLTKMDTNGNEIWTKQFGTAGDDLANGVAIGSDNEIYVVGSTAGALDGQTNFGDKDTFLVKYDTSGNRLWTRLLGTTHLDVGYGVTANSTEVAITGMTSNSLDGQPFSGLSDLYFARYLSDGTKVETRQWGTIKDEAGYAVGQFLGHYFVTGSSWGNLNGQPSLGYSDVFLLYVD